MQKKKKIIFLQGKVLGYFYELNIEGNDLNYDFSNQIITTSKETTYNYPKLHFIAKKSLFDIKENTIEMINGVKCEILK